MSKDDDPLRKLMAIQRTLSVIVDPGGLISSQRRMASLVDPHGLIAMQRKMASLVDPHGLIAMQRKMASLAGPGGLIVMHRKMVAPLRLGAITLAAQLLPSETLEALSSAVDRAQSGLIGAAASAVAATFPRHAQIATEALSALATLELAHHDAEHVQSLKDQSPLVAAIAELRNAIADSRSIIEDEKHFDQLVERVATKLASCSQSPKAPRWDLPTVIAFISLLLSTLFGVAGLGLGAAAESRAQRQETQAAEAQAVADDNAPKVQRALERLIELHEQEAERHARDASNRRPIEADAWYTVQRAVVLRARSDTKSARLLTLCPGAVVEVVGRAGTSVQVRYFDHLGGKEHIGWILKKYLIRSK